MSIYAYNSHRGKKEGGTFWVEGVASVKTGVETQCGIVQSSQVSLVKEMEQKGTCCGMEMRGVGCQAEECACCLGGCSGQFIFTQIFSIFMYSFLPENPFSFGIISPQPKELPSVSLKVKIFRQQIICFLSCEKKNVFIKGYFCWNWNSGLTGFFFFQHLTM